ncbi:MAG: hypothetical protein V5A44_02625 [Haloarculaceae archaeon]
MVEITILEVNLDAEDLVANAPFSSGGWSDDEAATAEEGFLPAPDEDDDDAGVGSGPNLKPVAVGAGLLVLVLLVVAVRRVLGGEPEPLP